MSRRNAELRAFLRRLLWLGLAIHGVILAGTVGFWLTSEKDLWESFVWSLDTVATVGSVPAAQDTGTQVVKVLLIMTGVGTLFYALVTVTEFVVAGHVGELLAERRMQRMIEATSDHYIICGFGRVGRQVARDLRAARARYVVVDSRTENRMHAQEMGVRFVEGDAGDDEVLRAAGIERAKGVIACVDSDAENIFVTLTARELRADLVIVARASAEDSEKKLLRAGADRVISPYKTSGTEMARFALHPQVREAVAVAPEYRMEEIEVVAGSRAEGLTIGDVRGGSVIFALRKADGAFLPHPAADHRLCAGDILLAVGTERTMNRLEEVFDAPVRARA